MRVSPPMATGGELEIWANDTKKIQYDINVLKMWTIQWMACRIGGLGRKQEENN